MCAISTGICRHVGMAHLCSASTRTARFTVAGMCSRFSGMAAHERATRRHDKRAGSKQDAIAEDCVATQWPGERACVAQSRSRRATYVPHTTATGGQSRSLPNLSLRPRAGPGLISDDGHGYATDLPSWVHGETRKLGEPNTRTDLDRFTHLPSLL
jgi:hypothetical protein